MLRIVIFLFLFSSIASAGPLDENFEIVSHKKSNSQIRFSSESEPEVLTGSQLRQLYSKNKPPISLPDKSYLKAKDSEVEIDLRQLENCKESKTRKVSIASDSVFAYGVDLVFYNPKDYYQQKKVGPYQENAVPYYFGKHKTYARRYDNRSSIVPLLGISCLPTRAISVNDKFPVSIEIREGEDAFR